MDQWIMELSVSYLHAFSMKKLAGLGLIAYIVGHDEASGTQKASAAGTGL
jgi:hypothetical protein